MFREIFRRVAVLVAVLILSAPMAARAEMGIEEGCNIATGFLGGEYGPVLNAVVPADPDPSLPFPIEELLRDLEELLRKYNIDPDDIDIDLLKERIAEELREELRRQGLSESFIDIIIWAFKNGLRIPNPFGDEDIKKFNRMLDIIDAIERFLRILRQFDLDEEILSLNDFTKFLQFADSNAECGNNDGNTSLEEIICYIQYLEDNSAVEGWENAYTQLIKRINALRKLLGLPPLEGPFIIVSLTQAFGGVGQGQAGF